MSIYLIDFENVHYDGLSGILNLTPEDQVYIFYSDNGKRLTFELHEQINNSPAQFYYYKAVVGGKNALDHQLSSYLGYLIGKRGSNEKDYFIVSKDRGYRHLVAFWEAANMGLTIHLVDSIRISCLSDEEIAKEEQEQEKAVVHQPADKAPSRRRGRVVKAKAEAESPAASHAEDSQEETATPPKQSGVKQARSRARRPAAPKATEVEARHTEEQQNISSQKAKEPPKIVEFILPEDIVSSVSHGAPTVQAANNSNKPADHVTARAGKSVTPRTKAPKTKNTSAIKDVDSAADDNKQQIQAKIAVKAEDIINLLPEAKGQAWLADIARYINNSNGKAQLYNAIRRRLGQDEGRKIYNIVKKLV